MPLPTVQQIVFEYLAAERDTRERGPALLEGLHARASSAGRCARAIGFQISGLEPTDPPTPDSLVNFRIGDAVHDLVQKAILARWPDAQTETAGTIGDFLSGHSDVLYCAEDGARVVLEIKSVSDFGFEAATGAELKSNGRWRRKEKVIEGPKPEHLYQAGIYAQMHGADYIAIVYVRKTAAKDEPILWEWRFKVSDLTDGTEAEIERLRAIVALVRSGRMPDREFEGKVILEPKNVKWPCAYCSYQKACISLGAGEVEIK